MLDMSVSGDEIRITKDETGPYFRWYIRRYHNGICTLIAGCNDEQQVIEKVAGLMNGTYYDSDDLK